MWLKTKGSTARMNLKNQTNVTIHYLLHKQTNSPGAAAEDSVVAVVVVVGAFRLLKTSFFLLPMSACAGVELKI